MNERFPEARFTGNAEGGVEDSYLQNLKDAAEEIRIIVASGVTTPAEAAKAVLQKYIPENGARKFEKEFEAISEIDLEEKLGPIEGKSWRVLLSGAIRTLSEKEEQAAKARRGGYIERGRKNPWAKR